MSERRWLLVVFEVPDGLSGLLAKHGFKTSKKNRRNWWRIFTPAEKAGAEAARAELLAAGLKGKWQEVEAPKSSGYPKPRHNTGIPKYTPGRPRSSYTSGLSAAPRHNRTKGKFR